MARTIGRNLFEGFVALAAIVVLAGLFVLPASRLMAQTTIYAGSIQGTITDPTGGVIPGAKVTITSKETARAINLVTSGSGTYSSGALIPGEYTVTIEAQAGTSSKRDHQTTPTA